MVRELYILHAKDTNEISNVVFPSFISIIMFSINTPQGKVIPGFLYAITRVDEKSLKWKLPIPVQIVSLTRRNIVIL
jgi:hypothetical protein